MTPATIIYLQKIKYNKISGKIFIASDNTEPYLEPCQTFMMELFRENS